MPAYELNVTKLMIGQIWLKFHRRSLTSFFNDILLISDCILIPAPFYSVISLDIGYRAKVKLFPIPLSHEPVSHQWNTGITLVSLKWNRCMGLYPLNISMISGWFVLLWLYLNCSVYSFDSLLRWHYAQGWSNVHFNDWFRMISFTKKWFSMV